MVGTGELTSTAPTASAHRRNNFDLIRLLAAIEVVIGHSVEFFDVNLPLVLEPVYTLIRWFPGVPIFFSLSGYLLAKSLSRNPDLRNYARNRSLRIFPALWACTLITAGILAVAGLLFQLSPAKIVAFLGAHATIGQNWVPSPLSEFGLGPGLTPNSSLWTIRVEIGFYFILPILLVGGKAILRSARRVDALLVLAALVSFAIYATWGDPADEGSYGIFLRLLVNSPAPYLWQFIAGVLLARHESTMKRLLVGRAMLWTAVFLAIRGTVFLLFEAGVAEPDPPLAALGLANLFLIGPSFALALSGSDLVRRLHPPEDISYGVYLWHMVIVNSLIHWNLLTGWAGVAATLVGAVVLGHLSWKLVEAPALARKKGALRPRVSATSRVSWFQA